jgi:hypothetical protein
LVVVLNRKFPALLMSTAHHRTAQVLPGRETNQACGPIAALRSKSLQIVSWISIKASGRQRRTVIQFQQQLIGGADGAGAFLLDSNGGKVTAL